MTRQAVILAGGLGTRLKSVTGALPKALAPVGGVPVLEHQLRLCAKFGFTDVVLLLGHGAEVVSGHVGDGKRFGVQVRSVVEPRALGTAGAVLAASPLLHDRFLVMYCDTMLDVDLGRLWLTAEKFEADAVLVAHPNDHPLDSDLLVTDPDGRVTAFARWSEKSAPIRNLASAALYVLRRDALQNVRGGEGPLDFGRDVFPSLLAQGKRIWAYRTVEYIKDLGTPDRLLKVNRDFANRRVDPTTSGRRRPAIFLDRDGVLNEEIGGVLLPNQLRLVPGAADAVRHLNEAGCPVVVVTNQPYVSHGTLSEHGLDQVHAQLEYELAREHAFVDSIYYCPHHPHSGYAGERVDLKIECECRKPKPGMILRAADELNLDLGNSWIIGDRITDLGAGKAAGIRTVLVRTGHGGRNELREIRPDFSFDDLGEATRFILNTHPAMKALCENLVRQAEFSKSRVILLGGQARSGKSTWAQVLVECLVEAGRKAIVLTLDDWLRDQDKRGPSVAERYDLIGVSSLVSEHARSTMAKAFRIPVYDRTLRKRTGERYLHIDPEAVLICEGVIALALDVDPAMRLVTPCREDERRRRFEMFYRSRGEEENVERYWQERLIDEVPIVANWGSNAKVLPDFLAEQPE